MRASTSDDHDRTGSGEGYGLPHKASLDEGASKFKKLTSLGSMGLGKASDGSLRGLFHRGTTSTEKSLNAAPGAVGAQYLREEIKAAREAVNGLDKAVSNAASFREKATKLLEEAHRALGRLEQAVGSREYTPDFITIACEVKCAARRGITLVDVYGKYSTLVKIMTFVMRSYIYGKFDKQINNLKGLLPASDLTRGAAASSHPASVLSHPLASIADSTYSALPQASGSTPSVASPLAVANSVTPPGAGTPSGQALPQPAGSSQALARSSLGNPLAAQPQASGPGPLVGIMLRNNKHDRVYAMAFVPPGQSPSEHVCVWWSAGSMLEYYSEATQATTGFQMEKASMHVTALGVDDDGNVWTGHAKGLVRVRTRQQWEYTVEDKAFTGAVKAIAFDEWGRAWVGDETGRIKVLGYDPRAGRLESVATLQRSAAVLAKMKGQPAGGAAGLFGKRHCSGTAGQPSAAAVYAMAINAAGSAAAAAAAAGGAAAGAVAAAVVAGRDVVAGPSAVKEGNGNGASTPPAGAGQVAIEGPVRCIFSRGGRAWTSGGRQGWLQLWDVSTFQDLDVRRPHARPHVLRAHPPRGRVAGAVFLHAPAATSWRLLTGHENGQLLLWHPNFNVLAPLLRIGEPCSPCRGIASFDSCRLVATGHQNGEMHLFVQPSNEGGLPPGSNSASPQSFGTLRPRMVGGGLREGHAWEGG
ncbi:hypothetical protein HYH03_001467 [Edaphochlamys debaryana]|uniref:Uncharacterized protein n=1 Tax=Edaphochlamys debaryana TaxID=47281 RepID=A0A835YD13_9CHLO|nr:hypothetical protein HYH03_001467 [Edaphochlamys debaryana]|eukprot:KAG2500702.1 hypothetical protein HYH03_001467 [Edaphochlamys debaryana]